MQIIFNGERCEADEGISLGEFIKGRGLNAEGSAAAVNESIVPKKSWESFILHEGMTLDVFSLVAGG